MRLALLIKTLGATPMPFEHTDFVSYKKDLEKQYARLRRQLDLKTIAQAQETLLFLAPLIVFDMMIQSGNVKIMKTTSSPFSPDSSFAQLPSEARALFFIYASASLARYQSHPPTRSELAQELETIWDTHRLTPQDLSNPYRMTRLLEQHFALSVPNSPDEARKKGAQ